ncbi:zinc-dependent metalloprotease family protein [Nocardioides nitrophenolicus]|uniref:zinc-dependent metalloprotease family protein n=1 Tax=Nocardioides nitrophenolicus TaxID=60489 RepID=UPI00195DB199|nr:M12 family metallo-peptidase [Nocardioides nitrophenolicus]MBM7516004.1 hypothetical protein [Nocardioides nitrophenolicus]
MQHLLHAGTGLAGLAALALAAGVLTLPPASADSGVPGLTAAEQRLLATDPSVEVAHDGTLYAVDEWAPPAGPAPAAESLEPAVAETIAATATVDTFALHSRPGAARTIYLDFDGVSLLPSNSWLLNGLSSLLLGGWSMDLLPLLFSDSEQAVIREVWARVAEDFAPWDVDVTTQEPLYGGLFRSSASDPTYGARVAFTSDSSVQTQLCGGGCGGIAWIGTYDEVVPGELHSPAWVFPASLGQRAKYMADAAAHEAGHTLGLAHDGTASSGYYAGSTLWGPIMGSPYNAAVTQWSRGDYPGASNREDDLAVIGAHGLPQRVDEAGSTPTTAADLTTLPDEGGVISNPSDSDWYALTDCGGTLTASVTPAAVGPNLDLVLELRGPGGAVLASSAPQSGRTSAGVPTGLGASLTVPLSGGPYYLAVSGGGSGAGGAGAWSSGGYDGYGSLGRYQVQMAGCAGGVGVPVPPDSEVVPDQTADAVPTPPATTISRPGAPQRPVVRAGARGGRLTIGVRWTAPTSSAGPITGYRLEVFRLDAHGRILARTRTGVLSGDAAGADVRLPRTGRWAVRLKARNALGWGPYSPRSVAAKAR